MSQDHNPNRRKILAGLAAVGVIGGGYGLYRQQATPQLTAISAANAQTTPAAPETPREVIEMALGAEDAPITVVEYASFTCPHCQRFHLDVFPQLKANFIDTGKIRFVLREVYFDKPGLWAGMVARSGGPMRYFGIVDLLFERQAEWSRAEDAPTLIASLFAIGRQAGLTDDEMDSWLQDQDFAKALVEEYQRTTNADGITGTPSFIVDGEKQSNMSYAEFETLLNAKLGE